MAVTVPIAPAMPNSRNGFAVARSKLKNPHSVVNMHQNDGTIVRRTARPTESA